MTATLIPNTNEEIDYADLFDLPRESVVPQDYGTQRHGDLYEPEVSKWKRPDCPLCYEPFAVVRVYTKRGSHLQCQHCWRKVVFK